MITQHTLNALLDHVSRHSAAVHRRTHAPCWTEEEDQFLKDHVGYLTDAEMAAHLPGRTPVAVKLRWKRDLYLPAPSKHPDIITAHQAAKLLGIDGHKVAHWVDVGLIPGRLMAGGRGIRLIPRISLFVWACAPKNWMWFDPRQVQDPKLKRLIRLEARRWGDEWWSTRKVAEYHGVDTEDVKRYIVLGRLPSYRLPFSLGGRDHNRHWSNHFIRRSDAVRVKFYRGRGNQEGRSNNPFTPAADRWILKARDQLGMSFVHIGKTMKIGKVKASKGHGGTNTRIAYRYHYLKAQQAAARRARSRRKGRK